VLKKRLAQNFGANLFAQFTNVMVQLASVPLFLSFWSKERYGAWLLISAIPVYLSLGEAGFATSSANEVSMAIAQGNRARALRSLHTAWGFLAGISVVLLALTLVAFFAIPWNQWMKFSAVTSGEVRWTIFLLNLYSIAAILIGIFGTIYRAAYRFARNNIVNTGGRLAELIGMGLVLVFTHSMICVAGAMLMTRLITLMVLFIDSRIFSPNLHLGLSGFSFAELKRTWRPSMMFMANTLGSAIYIQGLTLLVGASLGPVVVVVFNTTRTLTRVIVQFVLMVKSSVWVEFSYLFGAGDINRARRLNELAFEVSGVSSVVLAAMIFLAAPWIMPLWTHHAVQVDRLLLVILLSSAVLNGIWTVTSALLMGTNQHEGITVRYLMAATLALVLGIVTVHRLGIYGIALAMVVCELVLLPYPIFKTCHLLGQPVRELLSNSIQLRAVRQMLAGYCQRWLAKAG
jgi:O-antigen/teichoic acid export membrane protein